jgi:hypothetical protein
MIVLHGPRKRSIGDVEAFLGPESVRSSIPDIILSYCFCYSMTEFNPLFSLQWAIRFSVLLYVRQSFRQRRKGFFLGVPRVSENAAELDVVRGRCSDLLSTQRIGMRQDLLNR